MTHRRFFIALLLAFALCFSPACHREKPAEKVSNSASQANDRTPETRIPQPTAIQLDRQPETPASGGSADDEGDLPATPDPKLFADIKLITANLKRHPDDPDLLAQRGELFVKVGDAQGAVQDFSKLIELQPTAENFNRRALVHGKLTEDFKLALADHDRAIALSPEVPAAYKDRAEIRRLMAKEQLERNPVADVRDLLVTAVADLSKAIELEPENGDFYLARAHLHRKLGEFEQAADDEQASVKKSR
jgi:tetratricopeptide (TPR) repeat protein